MSNIEKVQKMVRGIYERPKQVGYKSKTDIERKEGEEWIDAHGRNWKIEDGKRKQITKVPSRGFDKCKDCKNLILKTIYNTVVFLDRDYTSQTPTFGHLFAPYILHEIKFQIVFLFSFVCLRTRLGCMQLICWFASGTY